MVSLNTSQYKQTLIGSIVLQLIIGIVGVYSLLLTIPKEFEYLYSLVSLETFVQFVELIFYLFFLIFGISAKTASVVRYYDWVFTTPSMLFTVIAYFYYSYTTGKAKEDTINNKEAHIKLKQRVFGEDSKPTLWQFLQKQFKYLKDFTTMPQHASSIIAIGVANFFMLLSGYLGEIKVLTRWTATIVGFLFFAIEFWLIYSDFVVPYNSPTNVFYFWILLLVWAMYGIAYMFNDTTKNVIYNGLDVVSKNMFGLLLSYGIYKLAV